MFVFFSRGGLSGRSRSLRGGEIVPWKVEWESWFSLCFPFWWSFWYSLWGSFWIIGKKEEELDGMRVEVVIEGEGGVKNVEKVEDGIEAKFGEEVLVDGLLKLWNIGVLSEWGW